MTWRFCRQIPAWVEVHSYANNGETTALLDLDCEHTGPVTFNYEPDKTNIRAIGHRTDIQAHP